MKINIDPEKRINLYNPEFDRMRAQLDAAIQRTIAQMIRKDMNAGAIGLKIDISLMRTVVDDDNAPTGKRPRVVPAITAKVATVIQQKDDDRIDVVGRKARKELLMDDAGVLFIVAEEEASGQLSMFNSWEEFAEEVTGGGDEEDGQEDAE